MNTKTKKVCVSLSATLLIIVPSLVSAAGLIPCGDQIGTITKTTASGVTVTMQGITNPCTFNDLMIVANNVISFIMYEIIVPLIALIIMYMGAKLILSPNKQSVRSDVKAAMGNVGWGLLIIFGAFVLIKFILSQFLNTGQGFTMFLLQ